MKINAAIIGTGIGIKHLEAIENYKGSQVKIICEINKKKINNLKKIYPKKKIISNYKEIFNDKKINLISIASYDDYHFDQVISCIKNKINFIVEKPMCLTSNELKIIEKKIKKSEIQMTSNLVLRTNDLFKSLKKKISKEKIFYIEADYIWGRKHKLFKWRSQIKNYSLVNGAMIHVLDLVNWLLEARPICTYALGSSKITKNSKFKKNSFVVTLLEYPNNIIVKLTANAVACYEHFHELKIFTENKTYQNLLHGKFQITKGNIKEIKNKYPDKLNRKKLIRNFIDCMCNPKLKPLISKKEQFDLMKICFAIDKSIKIKKKVFIRYD